jgi:hypothetical protein
MESNNAPAVQDAAPSADGMDCGDGARRSHGGGVEFQNERATWDQIEKPMIQMCVDREFTLPSHPDALKCGRKAGTDQTVFEHERMTPPGSGRKRSRSSSRSTWYLPDF